MQRPPPPLIKARIAQWNIPTANVGTDHVALNIEVFIINVPGWGLANAGPMAAL